MSNLTFMPQSQATITPSPEGLHLTSPYDATFVALLKRAIPASGRRWDGVRKQWLIDPAHGQVLVTVVRDHFGITLELPSHATSVPVSVTEPIQLAYLGACREREGGSVSASGYMLGNRNAKAPDLIFPEVVLKAWFEHLGTTTSAKPIPASSLYAVLCVAPDCDAAQIKQAYRRMARQTHPDVNKEPDATVQFQAIQHAYSILSDAMQRRKYDAGLALAARTNIETTRSQYRVTTGLYTVDHYRAPLRCGLLLIKGVRSLGRLTVESIFSWEELTNQGRALVSSWPQGATIWREEWVPL